MVQFHVYGLSRINKSTEAEVRWVAARKSCREVWGKVCLMGTGFTLEW